MPPLWLVGLLLILAVIGGIAIGERVLGGLATTNLTNKVVWGLWVAFYIYFIGLSAGSFLLSTLIYVFGVERFEKVGRLAIYSALILLFTGLSFIMLDLGHMERFITVYTHRNLESVLTWEIHFYAVYIFILILELYFLMRRDLIRLRDDPGTRLRFLYRFLAMGSTDLSERSAHRDHKIIMALGILGLPVAIGVHGGTGAIFAVAKARPYWFTGLFPIVFIVSALASGAGLLAVSYILTGDRKDTDYRSLAQSLGKMAAGVLAFDLLLLTSEVLVGMYSGIPEHLEVYDAIMSGPYWWVFWGGQLGLGAVIPIILILAPTGRNLWVLAAACTMIFLGIIGVRLNIVIPSLTVEMLPGIHESFVDTRASPFYFPSLIEILSSMGVIVANAILFWIGFALLPIYDRRLATRPAGDG
jgi:molybdopterin-containing oxidoreductase family membrane subunit